MKGLLIRFAMWILRVYKVRVIAVPPSVEALRAVVNGLITEVMGRRESGEWKRHQVLARLLKLGASESDAALAIELAVREKR